MWLVKVLGVIYLTAVCAAQDQEDATTVAREFAPTDPTPTTMSIGTVYVPPEPSVQLLSGWTEVFLSEKVEFSCNVDGGSDWTFTWYRDEQQVQDSDPNVSIEESTLTITAASDTQSGSYSCKGHHTKKSGVITGTAIPIKLKVHANKPKPSLTQDSNTEKMFLGESVTFTCKVTESSGWNYLWYHNGKEIQAADSTAHTIGSIDHPESGRYHCKAKRGKDQFFTEESDTKTLQVFDQPRPSVKMVSPWLEVFENETLAFSCEVDINDDWTYTWYKNKEVVLEDMNTDKVDSYLNITGITRASQGDYTCGVQVGTRRRSSGISNATHITVYENTPKPTLTKVPAFNPMYVGETVTFTCKVDVSSGWKYHWYRDRHVLEHTSETISIRLGLSDQGKYLCTATRDEMTSTDFSEEIPQDVLEIPLPSLKLETKWSDVFPDESVKLNCGMNSISDWTYTWEKGGQQVQADGVVSFNSNGATLDIRSAAATHAGEYHCKGHLMGRSVKGNSSSGLTLSVYDKKPRLVLTQDPDYKVMFPGESVSFTCHINVSSGWEYLWFKDGSLLTVPGNKYSISSVGSTNSGLYTCQVKRGTDRVFFTEGTQPIRLQVEGNKPKPSMTQSPNADKVFTGELVSFECKVALSSGWKYLWYKDEAQLPMNSSIFTIRDAIVSNSGTYKCLALRDKTTYSTEFSDTRALRVSEIPVPILKLETPWSDVFPTESVKLSCDMDRTSDWKYTWFKDVQQVQAENSVSFKSDGAILSIDSASPSHRGRYKCLGELKSRPVKSIFSSEQTLDVYDKKPRLVLTQDPDYKVMFPGESVSFTCHINVSSGWEYLWFKDGSLLTVPGNKYSISSVGSTNSGLYTCQVKRGTDRVFFTEGTQPIRLQVEGNKPKPSMTQSPNADKVFTGELVSFECKVALSSGWKYLWYKDEAQLPMNSSIFTIRDAIVSNSGTYKCLALRDKTTYSTEFSDTRALRVSEIPVPILKLETPWSDVFPTESVKLSCDMDRTSDWKYTWFKDVQQVQAENSVSFKSDGAILSIDSASPSHRGRYKCLGELKSRPVKSIFSSEQTLDVYDTKPRVTLMQNPTHDVMHSGDSVSFSCHTNVSSGWEYLWYKDGTQITESGNNYTIRPVATSNTGSYQCLVRRIGSSVFLSDKSQAARLEVKERPQADIVLLTGWSEVFSTDSLVLRCGVQESPDMWNYTWFKEGQRINQPLTEKHTVTPQNDPEQSLYTCQGVSNGRPSYSKISESFKTKNLLLKRRVLLSISGCIFFGIIAVFIGCIVLRIFRKPADDDEKPEDTELFPTMAQLKDRDDAACPLVKYITDAELRASPKEAEENGTICSETTPLPITSQEDQAVTSENHDTTENNGGLVSFKQ